MSVIAWTVLAGSLIFVLGLISAYGSRRQAKPAVQARVIVQRMAHDVEQKEQAQTESSGYASMAAGGLRNGNGDKSASAVHGLS